ncbi:recombinase family protein [Streptomyces sp. NPDC052207]|uniref:recombinase family protein n=1 Tax=Streptomyces sp. NPDC052207 TaxID=3155418 RepID=UPI00343C0F50
MRQGHIVEKRGEAGVARIKEMTGGYGAHSVVEAVGTQESFMQAVGTTRGSGHLGYVGVNYDVQIPGTELFFAGIHTLGGPAPVRRFLPDRTREIGFTSLHENLDTTPGGRLVFHVFAALAEFIRELIVQGTRERLAAARARGWVGGRPTVATEEVIHAARDLLPDPGRSITSIAKLLGVSPGTLYDHIPDLCELRAGAVPRQLDATER